MLYTENSKTAPFAKCAKGAAPKPSKSAGYPPLLHSESQCGQGRGGIDVCRDANLSPAFGIGGARRLGLGSVLKGITAQQEMCRQTIAGSQTKDNLSHFGRIAVLMAPVRLQDLGYRAHGRLIIREQVRFSFARTKAVVGAHSARFERADLDAKGRDLLGEGLGESPNGPLGSVVRRVPGNAQATAQGRYLKDAAAPLLAHDGQRGASHVDNAIEVGVDQRLESLL